MTISVNELTGVVGKASIGIGLPHGLADINAAAAAVLARAGLDAVTEAASALRQAEGISGPLEQHSIACNMLRYPGSVEKWSTAWNAPLACLWLMTDSKRRVELRNVDNVPWLAATLATVTADTPGHWGIFCVETEKLVVPVGRGRIGIDASTLSAIKGWALILRALGSGDGYATGKDGSETTAQPLVEAPEKSWSYLLSLADRTLVESTEQSRIFGAGYV